MKIAPGPRLSVTKTGLGLSAGTRVARYSVHLSGHRTTARRDPHLLVAVRYDRAITYQAIGQVAKARADFERVFAADPGYLDVRARLASS
jgi:Tfp pilus assembly protein PilF